MTQDKLATGKTTWMPTLDEFVDKLKRFGPSHLAMGGGVAGLIHLFRQQKENQAPAAAQPPDEVLTVEIPTTPEEEQKKIAGVGKRIGDVGAWLLNKAMAMKGAPVPRPLRTPAEEFLRRGAPRDRLWNEAVYAVRAKNKALDEAAAAVQKQMQPTIADRVKTTVTNAGKDLRDWFSEKATTLKSKIPSFDPKPFLANNWKTLGAGGAGGIGVLSVLADKSSYNDIANSPNGAAAVTDLNNQAASKGSPTATESLLGGRAMTMLAGGGATLLGYKVVDTILRNRERKMKERQLDRAKEEYGSLLGKSLAGGKTASEELFNLHGLINSVVVCDQPETNSKQALFDGLGDWLTEKGVSVLSVPSALAVLSGALAHNWMYKRQNDLDKMHEKVKPAPPKEIRLVSKPVTLPTAPVPTPKPEPSLTEEDDKEELEKSAELSEALEVLGLSTQAQEEKKAPDEIVAPKVVEVAPGTVAVETASGPLTIEAEDPAAARALSRNKGKIKKLMGILQAQPATALA